MMPPIIKMAFNFTKMSFLNKHQRFPFMTTSPLMPAIVLWSSCALLPVVAQETPSLDQPTHAPQRVKQYRVESWDGKNGQLFSEGTTIGYRKPDHRKAVRGSKPRLMIDDARAHPLISTIHLHRTSYEVKQPEEKITRTREEKLT